MTSSTLTPDERRRIKNLMAVRRLEAREESATKRSVCPALYVSSKYIRMVKVSPRVIPYIYPSVDPYIRGHWGL